MAECGKELASTREELEARVRGLAEQVEASEAECGRLRGEAGGAGAASEAARAELAGRLVAACGFVMEESGRVRDELQGVAEELVAEGEQLCGGCRL